ncbi:MAG: hypothetical protein JO328_21440 [Hyphomicrobiales bacterium]|nr:hypothetical protein [Hyphomicrobiales bacterium]MBV8825541.1 hypothetical protein [Hyphomicrobiales bacterium]MBV9427186.1 hypothetical protein [Bradyrhizobiaceae bacterium]
MRQRSSATFNFGCALAVVSTAVLAYGISSRPEAQERAPETVASATRTESVAVRSDSERNIMAMKLRAAEEIATADRALFIPAPTYLPPGYQRAAVETRSAPVVAAAAPMPTRRPVQMQLASIAAKPAVPAHSLTRPGAVLNDAQIASIKRRLNLTPDQERMWPTVEAALRNLSYAKHHGGHDAAQAVASIDPNSQDVQNLKSAAMPLVMSFSGDQMRELQSISRVAGLDKLVPNF